jgi:hypothetical protein
LKWPRVRHNSSHKRRAFRLWQPPPHVTTMSTADSTTGPPPRGGTGRTGRHFPGQASVGWWQGWCGEMRANAFRFIPQRPGAYGRGVREAAVYGQGEPDVDEAVHRLECRPRCGRAIIARRPASTTRVGLRPSGSIVGSRTQRSRQIEFLGTLRSAGRNCVGGCLAAAYAHPTYQPLRRICRPEVARLHLTPATKSASLPAHRILTGSSPHRTTIEPSTRQLGLPA